MKAFSLEEARKMSKDEINHIVSAGLSEVAYALASKTDSKSQEKELMRQSEDFRHLAIFFEKRKEREGDKTDYHCPNCFRRLRLFFGELHTGRDDPNPEVLYATGRTAPLESLVCNLCKRIWLLRWFDIPGISVKENKPK